MIISLWTPWIKSTDSLQWHISRVVLSSLITLEYPHALLLCKTWNDKHWTCQRWKQFPCNPYPTHHCNKTWEWLLASIWCQIPLPSHCHEITDKEIHFRFPKIDAPWEGKDNVENNHPNYCHNSHENDRGIDGDLDLYFLLTVYMKRNNPKTNIRIEPKWGVCDYSLTPTAPTVCPYSYSVMFSIPLRSAWINITDACYTLC